MPDKKKDGDIEHLPEEGDDGFTHAPGCTCGRHGHGDSHGPAQAERPVPTDGSPREVPDFPTEVTFKAVFRNLPYTRDTLKGIAAEMGLRVEITDRASGKGNFISYTITGIFPSDEVLQSLCGRISALEGFFTMF